MSQVLNSLAPNSSQHILCYYANVTSLLQILRITNTPNWYFERVVFPGQRLAFEAPQAAKLEIHIGKTPNAILSDMIPCSSLQVMEGIKEHCTNSEPSDGNSQCFL